jgi:hypothetical protein
MRHNQKYTTEQINTLILARGYLVDPEFVWLGANKSDISFFCPRHGKRTTHWSNFRKGKSCKLCASEQQAQKKISKIDWPTRVNELLNERNFSLLERPETLYSFAKIKVRCNVDQHEWWTCYNHLKAHKKGCLVCAGLLKTSFTEVKKKLQEEEFKVTGDLLPITFNSQTPIEVICPQGHATTTNANKVQRGYGCKYCAEKALTQEEVIQRLKTRGFTSTDSYKGVHTPMHLVCENGHDVFKSYMAIWHDETQCSSCRPPYSSKPEEEISSWLKTLLPENDILRSDRILLDGNEVDIYIPSKKLGIEFNGLYFHTEIALMRSGRTLLEAQAYHQSKTVRAAQKGVQLITLWDFEWEMRQQAVKTRLKSLLGLNSFRVGARKTTLRSLNKNEWRTVRDFLNTYHIQGSASFKYAYGLFLKDELVSVMTFQNHHRQNVDRGTLVLNRYCVKEDFSISGGATKLFQYAHKELSCPILSYSDNRWSTGDVYEKLGFTAIKRSRPDYFYSFRGKGPFSKQSLKKTPEERKSDKTERDLRLEQDYQRVWDCGKITWLYK